MKNGACRFCGESLPEPKGGRPRELCGPCASSRLPYRVEDLERRLVAMASELGLTRLQSSAVASRLFAAANRARSRDARS